MHGAWADTIDHNSPLYARKNATGDLLYLNVDWAVNYWLSKGMPKEKLVLGLATFGRTFTLSDSNRIVEGSSAKGAASAGLVRLFQLFFCIKSIYLFIFWRILFSRKKKFYLITEVQLRFFLYIKFKREYVHKFI